MKTSKHVLTKYETIKRVEKVEYEIETPETIKNKIAYAEKQVSENNYRSFKVVDIADSEMLDEGVVNLKKVKSKAKKGKR